MSDTLFWRCFHCDDVFDDERSAKMHFGYTEDSAPACKIKAGAESSLVIALRHAESELTDAWASIHNESTEAAKAYHAQQCRHQDQLRATEELGYERGLADGRLENPTPSTSLGGVEDRISALLSNPTAVLVNWLRGDINLDLVVERLKREGALPPPANLEWLVKLMGTGGYNFEDELNDEDKAKLVAIRQTITDPSPAARKEFK
ncbi:hypothetical protein [Rhizobium tumorigenes]|uniref:hypothetical protein n=1 Tax=Rhizobium tumorigenes TaxID=2041385 RepID=UPI00241EA357|nr:hypothetical protein [Rhizobium tumorigenes]WFS02196.1 hypothetical protein PR016_06170 [Rhizobium tumorigenes]